MPFQEVTKFKSGNKIASIYEDDLVKSAEWRYDYKYNRKGYVFADEQPWEFCRQGILKHVVHEDLHTREMCLDIYQQFIPGGSRSGKHRHMAEEVLYVLEGKGYDLHWDVTFRCNKDYIYEWEEEPKKFEWQEGDFIYVPPYTVHHHCNADPDKPVRLLSATNRIVKAMGMHWIDQLDSCPEYPNFDKWKELLLVK